MWIARPVTRREGNRQEAQPLRLPGYPSARLGGGGTLWLGMHPEDGHLAFPSVLPVLPYLSYMSVLSYTDFPKRHLPSVKFWRNSEKIGSNNLCTRLSQGSELRSSLWKDCPGTKPWCRKKAGWERQAEVFLFTFLTHSNASYCGQQTGKERTYFRA